MANSIDAAAVAAETIHDTATIVTMNTHRWGSEKIDRQTSAEVKANKGAKGKAGTYKINLANGFEAELRALTRPISRAYHYYLRATIAWRDGQRMLANTQLIDLLSSMQEHLAVLQHNKDELRSRIGDCVLRAIELNGKLGKRSDYPTDLNEIIDSYSFDFDFEPVPVDTGFGSLPEGFAQTFADNYNTLLEARLRQGVEDLYERLADKLNPFYNVLTAEKPKFFQSSIDNIAELTSTLRNLNVAQDQDIVTICDTLDRATGYTADQLKNNLSVREATAASVQAVLFVITDGEGDDVGHEITATTGAELIATVEAAQEEAEPTPEVSNLETETDNTTIDEPEQKVDDDIANLFDTL